MTEAHDYDVVVIGAGSSGENVADRAVRGGLTAALVEAELVGGECSYWACMPSKALLRPGQALGAARSVAGASQAVTGSLDVGEVLGRRDSFTSHWKDDGQVKWVEGAHITLYRGHARLVGVKQIEVEKDGAITALTARHAVVIATGSVADVTDRVTGLRDAQPWTPRQATSSQTVPAELIVMGGGVAGCELAQAYATLGSSVTIVELADRLLPSHEPFAGELVLAAIRDKGIGVHTGVGATEVSRDGQGRVEVHLADGTELHGDELLVAAGRRPATADVGLETIGLEPGSWLEVDDTMMVTGVDGGWLYGAGDVNRRALLTHQGKYQARICGDAIAARVQGTLDPAPWGPHAATADHGGVPGVVFTDPEVASVGLTEQQARTAGLNLKVVDYQIGDVAGAAVYADGYTGQARLVVDEDRHVIVGATFVGPGVSDLLHSATVAVVGEVPLDRLWHAVPSYPTISEVWLRLMETYGL